MKVLIFFLSVWLMAGNVFADRLKDISDIYGVRKNQLVGYGLVVGLDGTGDQTPFTNQTFRNMMARLGITIPDGVNPQLKNIAAVSVHAEIPAFAKPGQQFDVTISSIGNAKSLRGGSLLMTPLKGADGQVYAISQGNLVVGGFGAEGADGSKITVNIPSAGRIPNGATLERSLPNVFASGDFLTFNLHEPDFTTAKRVAETINRLLGPGVAYAMDAASIRVSAPKDANQRVSFLSVLENLNVESADTAAKIIINSRTGTIVISDQVKVSPVAVSHGNLIVTVSEALDVSQPAPLSDGETTVVPQSDVTIEEEDARMFHFNGGVNLEEIVKAVNNVGAAPGDLMAILEAMKQAGALKAELVVI